MTELTLLTNCIQSVWTIVYAYYTGDCQCFVDAVCTASAKTAECCNSQSMYFQSNNTCFLCKEIKFAVLLHNAVCMWSCTGCTCMISKIIGIVHTEATWPIVHYLSTFNY